MARSLDFDEQQLRALTYEAARAASAQRSAALTTLAAGLDTVSAASIKSTNADVAKPALSVADVAQVSTDLMMRQACYRSAAAVIANPVAPSLLEFLA